MTDDPANEVEALKHLASYYLADRHYMRGPGSARRKEGSRVELLPGKIPTAFPDDVPVFEDGKLLGSLEMGERLSVVFETDRDPEDSIRWYRDRLSDSGWIEPEPADFPGNAGFALVLSSPEDDGRVGIVLCRTPEGPSAHVTARRLAGQPTTVEVRVDLTTDPRRSPCTAAERMRRRMQRESIFDLEPVPVMRPPAGARQIGGGSGGGGSNWHASASLETKLDLADVADHYRGQLEVGGWRFENSGIVDVVAWSRWSFEPRHGSDGRGYLLIFGDERHYDLEIRASWHPDEEEDFGWVPW